MRQLLGFMKVLVTTKEIFIEELRVSEAARGKGISWQLLGHLLRLVKRRLLSMIRSGFSSPLLHLGR